MNYAYSSREAILFDVPQESYYYTLNYLFSILSNIDFTNYAYDTTPSVIEDDAKEVAGSLKNVLADLFCSFSSNQMKVNPNKKTYALQQPQ